MASSFLFLFPHVLLQRLIDSESDVRLINVMAVSLDGCIASHAYETDMARLAAGVSHPQDQEHLKRQIGQADAIIVGARTILAAGQIPIVQTATGQQPHWYIATRQRLPSKSRIWQQTNLPRTLVVPRGWHDDAILAHGVGVFAYDNTSNWPSILLAELKLRGVQTALLLGGATINREFYAANLVDELIVTILPIILGQKGAVPLVEPQLPSPTRWRLLSSQVHDDLVFLNYQSRK